MPSITKSELIANLSSRQSHLAETDVALAVKGLINMMSNTLSNGGRIEIRGFGTFNLHYHPPRAGRNPRTAESVNIRGKYVPYFKPGKELRKRVL
jgi:integration host factor subunit beta